MRHIKHYYIQILFVRPIQRERTQRGRLQDFSKKGQGTNKLCEVCHGARTSPPYIVKQDKILFVCELFKARPKNDKTFPVLNVA